MALVARVGYARQLAPMTPIPSERDMTETETVWVEIQHGWNIEYSGRPIAEGLVVEIREDRAARLVELGAAKYTEKPAPAPEIDTTGYLPVRCLSEIHLTGKSYVEGDILDMSPAEADWYLSLGSVEVIE